MNIIKMNWSRTGTIKIKMNKSLFGNDKRLPYILLIFIISIGVDFDHDSSFRSSYFIVAMIQSFTKLLLTISSTVNSIRV